MPKRKTDPITGAFASPDASWNLRDKYNKPARIHFLVSNRVLFNRAVTEQIKSHGNALSILYDKEHGRMAFKPVTVEKPMSPVSLKIYSMCKDGTITSVSFGVLAKYWSLDALLGKKFEPIWDTTNNWWQIDLNSPVQEAEIV